MQYVEAVVVTNRHCYSLTKLQFIFGLKIKRTLYFSTTSVFSSQSLLKLGEDGRDVIDFIDD